MHTFIESLNWAYQNAESRTHQIYDVRFGTAETILFAQIAFHHLLTALAHFVVMIFVFLNFLDRFIQ